MTLTAYAPGKDPILPHLPGGVPARRIPTASINGHSSYWIFKPDAAEQSTFELWKYAENSWADLEGDGLRGTDAELTRMAYRIARSATFGGSRPIPMPLHGGGVPGGLTPKRTVLNNGAHGQVSAHHRLHRHRAGFRPVRQHHREPRRPPPHTQRESGRALRLPAAGHPLRLRRQRLRRATQRVTLAPGQTKHLTFRLGRQDVGFYDNGGRFVVEPGTIDVYVGDSSTADQHDSFKVR